MVENLPAKQEMKIQYLGQKGPLEEEMATHPSILAWEIAWTEEPGRLQSMHEVARAGHDLVTKQQQRKPFVLCIYESVRANVLTS